MRDEIDTNKMIIVRTKQNKPHLGKVGATKVTSSAPATPEIDMPNGMHWWRMEVSFHFSLLWQWCIDEVEHLKRSDLLRCGWMQVLYASDAFQNLCTASNQQQ